MIWDEIEIPKEIRTFMLEDAEETSLGKKNGAKKKNSVMVICTYVNMMINF